MAALHQKLGGQQGLGPHHGTFLDVAALLERQSPEALNRLPGFTAGTSPDRFFAVKERMVLAAWKQEIASRKAAEEDLNDCVRTIEHHFYLSSTLARRLREQSPPI